MRTCQRNGQIERLARQYRFFHWQLAFPDVFHVPPSNAKPENEQNGWSGGFDVVLGNPPWERIKLQEKEWFATRRPDIAGAPTAAARGRMIRALVDEDPVLHASFREDLRQADGESALVRSSGRYPLCGRGDINTYAVFAETMLTVVSLRGRVGAILPCGIVTDDTTKHFFQKLAKTKALVSVAGFINEEMLFPSVLHNFKFCVLCFGGSMAEVGAPDFVFNCHNIAEATEPSLHFTLTADDLALLNPNTGTCPVFFWRRSAEITKEIYRRVPVLDSDSRGCPWGISFLSMFHMSNDSNLFATHAGPDLLPLYEAKMMNQFNHRFSDYALLSDEGRSHMLPEVPVAHLLNPAYEVTPFYFVPQTEVASRLGRNASRGWLVGFRGVASAGLVRTIAYCFLPICGAGNSLPLVTFNDETLKLAPCFVACMNSFVLDFVARQKLAGPNLNFFIKRQLAVLPPSAYRVRSPWDSRVDLAAWILPRVVELTYTSVHLKPFASAFGVVSGPSRWDEDRRFAILCELDAAFFRLFGVRRDDVDYVLETFPLVRARNEQQFGDYRTKRVILEVYDALAEAERTGVPYQTRLDPPPADPRVTHPVKDD